MDNLEVLRCCALVGAVVGAGVAAKQPGSRLGEIAMCALVGGFVLFMVGAVVLFGATMAG